MGVVDTPTCAAACGMRIPASQLKDRCTEREATGRRKEIMERATSMYKPVATWDTDDVVAWIEGESHFCLRMWSCGPGVLCVSS